MSEPMPSDAELAKGLRNLSQLDQPFMWASTARMLRTAAERLEARAMSRTAAPEGLRMDGGEITCFGNTYAATDPASVRRATLEEVAKFYESKGEKYIPAKFVAEHCRALAPAPGEGK